MATNWRMEIEWYSASIAGTDMPNQCCRKRSLNIRACTIGGRPFHRLGLERLDHRAQLASRTTCSISVKNAARRVSLLCLSKPAVASVIAASRSGSNKYCHAPQIKGLGVHHR
jgi:hypothetical protein